MNWKPPPLILLICFSVSLTSCVDEVTDIWINEDGSGRIRYSLTLKESPMVFTGLRGSVSETEQKKANMEYDVAINRICNALKDTAAISPNISSLDSFTSESEVVKCLTVDITFKDITQSVPDQERLWVVARSMGNYLPDLQYSVIPIKFHDVLDDLPCFGCDAMSPEVPLFEIVKTGDKQFEFRHHFEFMGTGRRYENFAPRHDMDYDKAMSVGVISGGIYAVRLYADHISYSTSNIHSSGSATGWIIPKALSVLNQPRDYKLTATIGPKPPAPPAAASSFPSNTGQVKPLWFIGLIFFGSSLAGLGVLFGVAVWLKKLIIR